MHEISVLMATYNGGKYIKEQLDSLQAQSYEKWSLYIRDDCSTDNTTNILKEYQNREPRIHLLPSSATNIGALGNFNRLMSNASGKYFMFCDQDDIWLPDKIKKTLDLMKNREKRYGKDFPILIHTDCSVIDSDPPACRTIIHAVSTHETREKRPAAGFVDPKFCHWLHGHDQQITFKRVLAGPLPSSYA